MPRIALPDPEGLSRSIYVIWVFSRKVWSAGISSANRDVSTYVPHEAN